jgi:outer membrane protein OmpA-like peptidoglycan-associated protein
MTPSAPPQHEVNALKTLKRTLVSVALFAIICGLTSSASAQETLDIQGFRPHAAPDTVFSVEGSRPLEHLSLGGGLILDYANAPLIFAPVNGDEIRVIEHQLAAHALLGFGLFGRLQLDASLPLYLIHQGDTTGIVEDGAAFSGFTPGDTGLRLKGLIWSNDTFGVGAAVEGTLPTGDERTFVGETAPRILPSLLADATFGPLMLAANVGVRVRRDSEIRGVELGSELDYRVGAQYDLIPKKIALDAEIFGRHRLGQEEGGGIEAKGTPLEFLVGGKVLTDMGLGAMLGAGTSILSGYGSPRLRVILGVTYAKPVEEQPATPADTDSDGVLDPDDSCVNEPEDVDGFEDEDGCPDADNDQDGILDADDKCPLEAEDVDSFEDEDGCPDPDNDQDGVLDAADKCPLEAEDKDGVEDDDGCPEVDTDGDGIQDDKDKCVDEPEDIDSFEDEDGCPDPDNDQDGILDGDDKCPNKAGPPEGKGCPVTTKGTKVVVTTKTIEFDEKIFFDHDKAVIKGQFKPALDEVAKLMKKYPQIELVEIEGHTSELGAPERNQKLSQQRANAVRDYLVKRGVAKSRLTAVGYGASRPIVKVEVTEEDRARNRRVVFSIKRQKPIQEEKEVPATP